MYKNKRRTQANKCEKPKNGIKNRAKGKRALRGEFTMTSKFGARRSNAKENANVSHDKITSERVTVPFQFFGQGVKSKTVRRKAKDCTFKEQRCNFLKEDLHALLETVSVSSKEDGESPHHTQSPSDQTHYDSITNYFVNIEAEQLVPQKSQEQEGIVKNDGGSSLFKEINCLFREAAAKQDISNIKESTSTFDYNVVNQGCFCEKLKQQLCSVTLTSRRARCIKKITALVAEINTVLEGQETVPPLEVAIQNRTKSQIEANLPTGIPQLIPKSSWIYKTPSNQKLRRPVVTSCANELRPCLLQADARSNVVFELDTTATNLDFLTTSIHDIEDNSSVLNHSQNEPFKIPAAVDHNMFASRSVTSLFSNSTIPLFEDIKEPLQKAHKNSNLPIPHRPSKTASHIIRDNLGTPRCLFFAKTNKRQKLLLAPNENEEFAECLNISPAIYKNRAICSKKNKIPATVTSQNSCRFLSQLECSSWNKENYRPHDFSNHPKSTKFPLNETSAIDENFLLPTVPNLSDPLPLSFYPRSFNN